MIPNQNISYHMNPYQNIGYHMNPYQNIGYHMIPYQAYEGRPRILLLNKADLVKRSEIRDIGKQISIQESIPVIPTWIKVYVC